MGWQQRIVTLLILLEKSPKIISDTTGVLFSQTFKQSLIGSSTVNSRGFVLQQLTVADWFSNI